MFQEIWCLLYMCVYTLIINDYSQSHIPLYLYFVKSSFYMYKTFRIQYLGTNKDLKSINTVIILFEYLIIFKYHIPIISSHEKRLKIKTLKGYSKIGGFLFRKWKISCLEKINILLCMYHRYKKVKNLKKRIQRVFDRVNKMIWNIFLFDTCHNFNVIGETYTSA